MKEIYLVCIVLFCIGLFLGGITILIVQERFDHLAAIAIEKTLDELTDL